MSSTDYKRLAVFFILSLIILSLVGKFILILLTPINQDEFFYLSRVHDYMNTRLTDPFQNFHVYFFQWVTAVSTNEVSQIKACRMVMYLFFSGTCFFIYLIGKDFSNTSGGFFSVLCYISFIFTTINGAGFRSDTIPIFLFLFSLYNLLKNDLSVFFQILSGLAMAVAVLLTLKSAIYLIVFAVLIIVKLFFYRLTKKKLLLGIIFPLSFVVGFALLYKLQSLAFITPALLIPSVSQETLASIKTLNHTAGDAYSTFVLFDKIFPQFDFFKLTLKLDWLIWLCLFIGIIINVYEFFKNHHSFKNTTLFILLVPLFSILFYRNAFPYFYLFITPTATVLCGYAIWKLTLKIENKPFYMIFLSLISGLIFFNSYNTTLGIFIQSNVKIQNQTLDVIHRMFPKPVPYIDGCSMVSSFPKAGFFMSSAGMRGYLKRNKPVMRQLLQKKRPLFLLANVPHLNLNFNNPPKSDTGLALLEADWLTLKSNFVHHWGDIWVIGKQIKFPDKHTPQKTTIIIPGFYTPSEPISIDDHLAFPEKSIYLTTGVHLLNNPNQVKKMTLKWGYNLYTPEEPFVGNSLFLGHFL